MRLTYRVGGLQKQRLGKHKKAMGTALGQEVSWQLVLSSVIEAGLDALGIVAQDGEAPDDQQEP
jgi:hypothetical protein